jgi:CheY-like chemotaxis protein
VRFTVLLIDDEQGAIAPLAEALRSRGCRVWTASTARDALVMVQRGWISPSLVLVGLGDERVEYESFLWACAADPTLAGVPVVVMTSTSAEDVRSLAGVVGAIRKPVAPEQLIELIDVIDPRARGGARAGRPDRTMHAAEGGEATDPGA